MTFKSKTEVKCLNFGCMACCTASFVDLFYLYLFFHIVLSASCSLVVTCRERADLLALQYVTLFITFPYGVLGQVWYLIVSIPDHYLPPFYRKYL